MKNKKDCLSNRTVVLNEVCEYVIRNWVELFQIMEFEIYKNSVFFVVLLII